MVVGTVRLRVGGAHEGSLQPPVWRFYTPCTPLPVPFGCSRHMKPLKWSVIRSTVDSRAHLRRFGYPQRVTEYSAVRAAPAVARPRARPG
eukprot:4797379-Prymnesium_polylepis.1